jgi:anti-sigma-K factor RskA
VEALRADLAKVDMSATGPQPPQRSRQRLMHAIATGPREESKVTTMPAPQRGWPRWLILAPVAAALVLAVACGALMVQIKRLEQALADERRDKDQAQKIVKMLKDPPQEMVLVAATRRPPRIRTIYEKKEGQVVLLANSLDPIPEDKVYELWLLPSNGGDPMPAGTFNTDSNGNMLMIHKLDNKGIDAKAFAVTVEPTGGSKTPTMPIVYAPEG